MTEEPHIVGKTYAEDFTATLTDEGWAVEGEDSQIIRMNWDCLNTCFPYSSNPARGQPGVYSLRQAAEFLDARMKILTEIGPQDDLRARY